MCENATDTQIGEAVKEGALEALKFTLSANDARLVADVLSGINAILETGEAGEATEDGNEYAVQFDRMGGTSMLEGLLQHQNMAVYRMAREMLERYFFFQELEYNRATGVASGM